jgi:hypothetical protein
MAKRAVGPIITGLRLDRNVPVPVDAEGLAVEIGKVRCPTARLACVTPSHLFPLGATMSLPRRLALLDWACQAGAWIIEDDYDSEYRYAGKPLTALQGLDRAGRVIYVGTFSKVLFPVPPAREGRLTMAEIIFSLKHYWRFVDSEVLELTALSQGMDEKAI